MSQSVKDALAANDLKTPLLWSDALALATLAVGKPHPEHAVAKLLMDVGSAYRKDALGDSNWQALLAACKAVSLYAMHHGSGAPMAVDGTYCVLLPASEYAALQAAVAETERLMLPIQDRLGEDLEALRKEGL